MSHRLEKGDAVGLLIGAAEVSWDHGVLPSGYLT